MQLWKVEDSDFNLSAATAFFKDLLFNIALVRPEVACSDVVVLVFRLGVHLDGLLFGAADLLQLARREEARVHVLSQEADVTLDALRQDVRNGATVVVQWHVWQKLLEEVFSYTRVFCAASCQTQMQCGVPRQVVYEGNGEWLLLRQAFLNFLTEELCELVALRDPVHHSLSLR